MKAYDHNEIEPKWQALWEETKLYKAEDIEGKPKSYVLDMFPYPSGEGLHTGHCRIYTASDVYARMKRMQGFSVLHPTGWDAFGLPAEQFALKNKIHPRIATDQNTSNFRRQMKVLGFSYDWDREIDTTDEGFYAWTQWIFLKIHEKGLAYESWEPINWCPTDQTGLANEDVEDGKCERCGTPVEKRPMRQWVLRITEYAERLLNDLDTLTAWPNAFKDAQRNWIGKSEGALFDFSLSDISGQEDGKHKVSIFTTRPDTLFGATYIAVSAALAKQWLSVGWKADEKLSEYIESTIKEQASAGAAWKEIENKTGMFSGIHALHPGTGEKIPVYVANYVLSDYGTGAVMGVPAHDERDFAFAEKYNIPIVLVIDGGEASLPYLGVGKLVSSGKFTGTHSETAKKEITKAFGTSKVEYKLRDWVFSRQRYWGEPMPIVHDEEGKSYTVDESELPVVLPKVDSYEPTGTGESPLANIKDWVEVTGFITEKGNFRSLPKTDSKAKLFKRETNTMPQWAGSSWYYLRFIDPRNTKALIDPALEKKWSPVDVYVGGAEHATRHLIYARFWHKFLQDIGVVSQSEPFTRLESVGLILGEGGVKMSKRLGNVINPDDVVKVFGADTLRLYEMFIGPFGQAAAWNTDSIVGPRRFVERVFHVSQNTVPTFPLSKTTETILHQTIKKVTSDIEQFKFNTAVSQLMICLSALEKEESISKETFESFLKLLAPFAPFVSEEIWKDFGHTTSIHKESWPLYDENKLIQDEVKIVVQINGKVREELILSASVSEEEVVKKAYESQKVMGYISGKTVKKTLYVKGKLLSIVVE